MQSIEEKPDRDTAFVQMCAGAGIKATQQRREIYRDIQCSAEHPDAAMVYRRLKTALPALSLDTVYRNLHTLEAAGIIRRIAATDSRARYEGNLLPHHHFVCNRCERIYDFNAKALNTLKIPAESLRHGQAESLQIAIIGVCNSCRETN